MRHVRWQPPGSALRVKDTAERANCRGRRVAARCGVVFIWDRLPYFSHGTPLRSARLIAGLSQDELAELVGSTRRTISSLERGTSLPSVGLALAVARALNRTVEELFGNLDRA